MRGLKQEIEKDLQLQMRMLKSYRQELAALPRGSMAQYRKNGRVYYKYVIYGRSRDGNTTRAERHLGKKDEELIYGLQRRAYLKEAVRRMEKNLKTQKKSSETYLPYDYYSIWDSLSEVYRPDNVAQFLKQEGVELGYVGEKGQIYRRQGLVQNTSAGFSVRSKGETLIAEALMARKIVFRFEKEFRVTLPNGQVIILHPDFVIPLRDGSVLLWEHMGRLSDRGYAVDAGERLYFYNISGYRPGHNLILTADDSAGNTDMRDISTILDWLEGICLFEE